MASLDALILHGAGTITGAVSVGDTTLSIQVPQNADLSGSTPVPFAGQDILIGTEDVRIASVLSSITHGTNYDYHLTIEPLTDAHAKGTSATFRPYLQRIDVPDPVIIEVGQKLRIPWTNYWKAYGDSNPHQSGGIPSSAQGVIKAQGFYGDYSEITAIGVGATYLQVILSARTSDGTYTFRDILNVDIGVVEVNKPPVISHTFAPLIFVPGRITTRTVTPGNHFSDPNGHAMTFTIPTLPADLTATDNGDGTWDIVLDSSVSGASTGTFTWQAVDTRGGTLLAQQTYSSIINRAPFIQKHLPELTEPIGATAHSVYEGSDYIVDGGDGETLSYSLEIDDPVIAFATDGSGTFSDQFFAQRFASGHTQYEYAAPASAGDTEIEFRAYGAWQRGAGEMINWIGATVDGIKVIAQRRPGTQTADPFFLTLERGLTADVVQSQTAVATGFRYPLSDGRWQLRGETAGKTTVTLYGRDSFTEVSTQAILEVSTPPAWTAIPDQTLVVGATTEVDLSAYSSDADGDALTYSVTVGAAHVQPLVQGSTLFLLGLSTTTGVDIKVGAEDPAGLLLETTITIAVTAPAYDAAPRVPMRSQRVAQLMEQNGQDIYLLWGDPEETFALKGFVERPSVRTQEVTGDAGVAGWSWSLGEQIVDDALFYVYVAADTVANNVTSAAWLSLYLNRRDPDDAFLVIDSKLHEIKWVQPEYSANQVFRWVFVITIAPFTDRRIGAITVPTRTTGGTVTPVAPSVPVPAAPTGLTATVVSFSEITISWNDPLDSSITHYEIWTGGDNWATISGSDATTTSYAITGLNEGSTYRISIRAVNAGGNSPATAVVSATTLVQETAPTSLAVSAVTATSVSLSWSAPKTFQFDAYEHNVDGSSWFRLSGSDVSTTSQMFTGLRPSTTYRFGLRAAVYVGLSFIRAGQEAFISVTTLVAAPTSLTATATSATSIALSWDDPSDSEITSYEYRIGSGSWVAIPGSDATTTSYTLTGVTTNIDYTLSVRAVSSAGNGGPASASVSLRAPSAPTGLAATVTQSSLTYTWNDPSDSAITRYEYQQDAQTTWNAIQGSDATTTTFTLSGQSAGTSITFRLRAVSVVGGGAVATLTARTFAAGIQAFMLTATNEDPRGMWSDGTTLWVVDGVDRRAYAYALASRSPDSAKDIAIAGSEAHGLWSDRTTMWITRRGTRSLQAYTLATGARDSSKEFSLDSANANPRDIWSNGTTLWVVQYNSRQIYAYTLADGSRDSAKEFDLDSANSAPVSIWSNGTTIWVDDRFDDKAYAYTLATGSRDSTKDFDYISANTLGHGMWSDGTTMLVSQSGSRQLYAYTLPA